MGEKPLVDLPVTREVHHAGDPHDYGWVRVTHTILHVGQVTAVDAGTMEATPKE